MQQQPKQQQHQAKPQPQNPKPAAPIQQDEKVDIQVVNGNHVMGYKHRHDGLTFNYPTLGIPIPGQKYNNTRVLGK